MYCKLSICSFLILCIGCVNEPKSKSIEIKTPFGEIAKGTVFRDSIFHGEVKYYSENNKDYLGYATFKYGYEVGPYVRVRNGIIADSLYYEQPLKRGFEYVFDSTGKLSYKAYLYDGRVFGPAYEYNSEGNIQHFYFYSFEGDVLYQSKYDHISKAESGSVINLKTHDRVINNVSVKTIFLYVIRADDRNYYEIAVMDDAKKVLNSKRVQTNSFVFETVLEPISSNQHYAIIYHDFDPQNNDNIIIQEIIPSK